MKLDAYGNLDHEHLGAAGRAAPGWQAVDVPIRTYQDVPQFWTFDPDKFLEQPVYSRDFRGLPDQLRQLGRS